MYVLKTLKDLEIKNKRVLLRVDFNVPIEKGVIQEEYKITQALPTIEYLLKYKNKIIVVSHLGRPEGKVVSELSFQPIYDLLKNKLKAESEFISGACTTKTLEKINNSNAEVIFLDNIRFNQGEETKSPAFINLLASFADIFVNEAFAVSHRDAASVTGVAKVLPSCAGFNFEKEVKFLNKALEPKKKAAAIVGGAKAETKLPTVFNLMKKYDFVLVSGAVSNTILAGAGYEIGNSVYSKELKNKARALINNKKIFVPIDFVVADSNHKVIRVVKAKKNIICKENEEILDIGPETIKLFSQLIRKAKTIVWAGPLGLFEEKSFAHGTMSIAKLVAARSSGRTLGIIGGGDTVNALNKTRMGKYIDFISTGGGAMLEFLEGKVLPGMKVLLKK